MKLRYFEYRKARIEIIPMIDVMLFLLVFFVIITLQMIPDAGVNLQLPTSTQSVDLPHPKLTVNVAPDGTIQVKGQTMTDDQLTALFQASGDPTKLELTIATDKTTPFQKFMNVIDDARKANVTDIGIAAQPIAAGP
jgi:biopolymer transport protein ExbD